MISLTGLLCVLCDPVTCGNITMKQFHVHACGAMRLATRHSHTAKGRVMYLNKRSGESTEVKSKCQNAWNLLVSFSPPQKNIVGGSCATHCCTQQHLVFTSVCKCPTHVTQRIQGRSDLCLRIIWWIWDYRL